MCGKMGAMDILGAAVLIDPDTDEPYAAPFDHLVELENNGPGIIGGVVLIDPETKQPYKIS